MTKLTKNISNFAKSDKVSKIFAKLYEIRVNFFLIS